MTGYDCEFVDPVCKDVQTDCSICLLILREPYIVQCCGNRFCRSCLVALQAGAATPKVTPCPLCKQKIVAAIPDKQLERLLNDKHVFCSNKSRGCTWSGELVKLEGEHLNKNPTDQALEELMEGCMYVQVLCYQCKRVTIERQEMADHLEKKCPRRMAVCTYCKVHRAAYEDISRSHHPVCRQIPVPCPKGCGAKPLRKNIESHVENWCPKNPQPCPFHVVGCTKKLAGHQMEKHLRDWVVYEGHLSNMEKTVAALRKDICEKDSQIKTLQMSLDERDAMRDLAERKDEMIGNLKGELETCEAERSRLEDQGKRNEQEVNTLRKELYHLNKVCAQNRRAAESTITSLFREVTEKSKQIEELKKKIAHEEQAAKQSGIAELRKCNDALRKECAKLQMRTSLCKKENTGLREHIGSLKRENEKLNVVKEDLQRKVQGKADYADTLKRQVRELQQQCQAIQSQKEDLERLDIQERDLLKRKVTELQVIVQCQKEKLSKVTDQAHRKQDSLKNKVTELEKDIQDKQEKIEQLTTRLKEQTSQIVNNPRADDGGAMPGAASVILGAAVIAAVALVRQSTK